MGGPPVDAPARRTLQESPPGPMDVRGDPMPNQGPRHRHRRDIALQAPPTPSGRQQVIRAPLDYLAELMLDPGTLDQEGPAGSPALHQPAVPGEENPPFAGRHLDQLPILDALEVADVVPEDPQPAGQPPEHAIGGEAERLSCDSPESLC